MPQASLHVIGRSSVPAPLVDGTAEGPRHSSWRARGTPWGKIRKPEHREQIKTRPNRFMACRRSENSRIAASPSPVGFSGGEGSKKPADSSACSASATTAALEGRADSPATRSHSWPLKADRAVGLQNLDGPLHRCCKVALVRAPAKQEIQRTSSVRSFT